MHRATTRRTHTSIRGIAVLAAMVVAVAAAVLPTGAAASAPAGGSSGDDISWPQCAAPYPSGGSFGIVGVNDGRAWSTNPCLASEYAWAAAFPRSPDLYMNTANPAPHSSFYWPTSGTRDPALCLDATSTIDPGCAYDYGWHTAADALARATAALGAPPTGGWWLDVETGNTWNGDTSSNAADLQGSIDYLIAQGAPAVGVYSTGQQWSTITGGYAAGSAAQYASAWAPEFSSPAGIAGSPSWVAGASGPSDVPGFCASSFTGTTTWLVQSIAGGFDVDTACGSSQTVPAYSLSAPADATAVPGVTVPEPITLTSTGAWAGTVKLSVSAPPRVGAVLSSSSVALATGATATTTLSLRSSRAGTFAITITAHPARGSTTGATASATIWFTVGAAASPHFCEVC